MEESHVPGLCQDVVFRIMLWLPVASLLRFKLVCKSWRSHIESPDFIHQHALHHQISDDDGKLLVFNFFLTSKPDDCSQGFDNLCFTDCFRLYSGQSFSRILRLKDSTGCSSTVRPDSIISSFNGIVFLQSFSSTHMYLWNPLTKQLKILPSPHYSRQKNRYCPTRDFNCGFGFDAKTKDYKVVIMLVHHDSDKNPIEIYSLRTNSWRVIDSALPVSSIHSTPKSPLSNGGIYCWLVTCTVEETHPFFILSFDFSTEMFDTLPVPDVYSYPSFPLPRMKLDLLRGKIALIESNFSKVEDNCKVWVLQEFGVKESWTNLYSLRLESLAHFYGFSTNGKIILGEKDGVSLSLYDPANQEVMVISSEEVIKHDTEIATYKESLVSITSATDTCEELSSDDDEDNPWA